MGGWRRNRQLTLAVPDESWTREMVDEGKRRISVLQTSLFLLREGKENCSVCMRSFDGFVYLDLSRFSFSLDDHHTFRPES